MIFALVIMDDDVGEEVFSPCIAFWESYVKPKLEMGFASRNSISITRSELQKVCNYLKHPSPENAVCAVTKRKIPWLDKLRKGEEFRLQGDTVQRRQADGLFVAVIPLEEFFTVIERFHGNGPGASHHGCDKTFKNIKEYYSGIPRDAVQTFTNLCLRCNLIVKPQKVKAPLRPILSKHFLQRLQMDLVNMSEVKERGFSYFGHVVDHFTKFHIIFTLATKSAEEFAAAFQERVLAYFVPPVVLQSDNGGEFRNHILPPIVKKWCRTGDTVLLETDIIHGRPRHPQSQGCVEQGNKVIKKQLGLMSQHADMRGWTTNLPLVMWRLNTTVSETTGCSPFRSVFGMTPPTCPLGEAPEVLTRSLPEPLPDEIEAIEDRQKEEMHQSPYNRLSTIAKRKADRSASEKEKLFFYCQLRHYTHSSR